MHRVFVAGLSLMNLLIMGPRLKDQTLSIIYFYVQKQRHTLNTTIHKKLLLRIGRCLIQSIALTKASPKTTASSAARNGSACGKVLKA